MLALNAHADFTGQVVSVADGDTITVLRDRTQVKVRLLEIDAPEKAQAFGTKSKESLSEMCFGKSAELADKGKDRYDRLSGRRYRRGSGKRWFENPIRPEITSATTRCATACQ